KLRRRLDILIKSTSWPEDEKEEIRCGMSLASMSPEHSEDDERPATQDNASSSDSEEAGQVAKKIIKIKRLSWRSDRFSNILDSLDNKHLRKVTEKSRSMMKERIFGETITVEAPENIPDWREIGEH
ncbi:Hypothetical predicted protein, partial [Paramuricea clavata]